MPTTRASRSDTRSSCARHADTRPRPPSTTTAAGRGNLDQHGVHFLTAYSLAAEIASPRAFIATVTTRMEINELCGRPGRGASVTWCQWLPEPIITDVAHHPAGHAETADSLSLAMLVVLESLSPEQRCTAVARRVRRRLPGDHGIVGKSGDNVRQLATRARQQVKARLPRFCMTRGQQPQAGATLLCGRRAR